MPKVLSPCFKILPTACQPFGFYKNLTEAEYMSLETEAGSITKTCQWLKEQLIATGNFVDADLTIVIA